jgi:CelD/BcsL family acetyltransferase involved in cellulose biosynthesis
LRTSLQRGRARLKRAGELSLEVVLSPGEALERALQDYEAVYAASWKPAEGSAAFIRGLVRWMAGRDELRLGVLRLNGEPLAAQIWFVSQGVASIFKLAHIDGKEALSPGTVLTAELMSRVIDVDGVHTVDFISGDDGYKRDWMSERRQRMALLAFDPLTARGLAGAFRHALRARLSRA